MVAPAGVSGGVPHDPVTAGGAGVEVAEGPAAKAKPTEAAHVRAEPTGAMQAGAAQADTVQAGAAQAREEAAGVIPAEVVPVPAKPAEEDLAETAPAEEDLAETAPAEEGPAETAPAEAERAAAGPAEAERAAADPGGTEPADSEVAEAGAGGPDWDPGPERRDVSPLAVVGTIVGIIALVGVAVGVLDVITHGFRPKTVITYRPAAVFGLRPGDCVNSGANALNVTVVSCATPHDAEVFAAFRLPATGWPGASAVQQAAGNGCQSRLAGYLNPQLATVDLTQEYVYPNQAAWQAGERTVVCEVRSASGPLTGSVHATG